MPYWHVGNIYPVLREYPVNGGANFSMAAKKTGCEINPGLIL